jgi:hypothetical protein
MHKIRISIRIMYTMTKILHDLFSVSLKVNINAMDHAGTLYSTSLSIPHSSMI